MATVADVSGSPRSELDEVLADYPSGPDAPLAAIATAAEAAQTAERLILVEGISDQIAVTALAERQGRDLVAEGTVVFPIGGAQAVGRYLVALTAERPGRPIGGLFDAAEEPFVIRAVADAGLASPADRVELGRLGFFTCVEDLEDELIDACGHQLVEEIIEQQGELRSLRTMQKQAAWRDRSLRSQLRRFVSVRSGRKHRYARLLTMAVDDNRVPAPLRAVLQTA